MMGTVEVTHNGHAIGQFISGPDQEMVIQYMPYRSGWHYQFGQALQNKEVVVITIGKEKFIALKIIKPHYLLVSREGIS